MATLTTYDPNWLYSIDERYQNQGGTFVYYDTVYNYNNAEVAHKNVVDPVTVPRAKPADLVQNPTNHGPAHRFHGVSGRLKGEQYFQSYSYGIATYRTRFYVLKSRPPYHVPEHSSGSTKHNLKLRRLTHDISSFVAELNKTADSFTYLAKTVGKIVNRVRGLRKGRFTWHDVAETNLAINFGIKPVISDMFVIADGLSRFNQAYIHRVHSRSQENYDYVDAYGFRWVGRSKMNRVSYVRLNEHQQAGNLNIGNPIEWAWELIPFSFVVDWVIPVGDAIAALYADRGLQLLNTCVTRKVELGIAEHTAPPAPGTYEVPLQGEYQFYERKVVNDFESPDKLRIQPTDSLVALGNAVSLLKALRGSSKL